jgi:hypothetical protein
MDLQLMLNMSPIREFEFCGVAPFVGVGRTVERCVIKS